MKKSIRTRILVGVVLINLVGAIVLMVVLHQSFSGGLDAEVAHTATQAVAAWEQLSPPDGMHPVAEPVRALEVLDSMKAITGTDYGLLIYKEGVDETSYATARETIGQPSLWEEGGDYALLAATDEDVSQRMQFAVPPAELPENGRAIGVEVGSCSQACHNTIAGEGDFWTVRWSKDKSSSGHAVFPVYAGGIDPIGVVYALEDISSQADSASTSLNRTLLAVGGTLLVTTLVIGALIDILVLRRLATMTHHIQDISIRVAGGDFDASYEPDGTVDEIGSFQKFYADFIHLVSMTLKSLSSK